MRLTNFITEHMEEILQEWQTYAQTINVAKEMDQQELRDHAKEMLDAIAKDLTSPQTPQEQIRKSHGKSDFIEVYGQDAEASASVHGISRFSAGFGIEDLVAEYRALRASILRLWGKCSETVQQTDLDDMTRFNEAIDQALAKAITTYVTEKNKQVRLFETIVSSSPDHHCIMELDGKLIYANASLSNRFRASSHQLVGKSLFNLCAAASTDLPQQIKQVIDTKKPVRGEITYGEPSRKNECYEYIFTPIFDGEGQVEGVAGTARDITERKTWDEQIWRKANYDFLTGLPNRLLFRDRLAQELKHASRAEISMALLFIDLDRFKEVNDMLGHDAGDILLRQAAERIRACIREKDTVARLGGDEFTVILSDIDKLDHTQVVANKILKELANPFVVSQDLIQISSSIGITLFPQDAITPDLLLKNADQAMYVAKNAGRNQFRFFTRFMHEAARTRYQLTADLRRALPQGQMALHYQPIIDLSNGKIFKAEALLRWFHPQTGLMLPEKFIEIAEETGIINEIGNWVFTEAAKQSKIWGELLGLPFQISINKSPVQFMAHAHGLNWGTYLQRLGIAYNSISVEITEGVLLNATGEAAEKLAKLQELGIELAVDDFGTGYSSMSYLNKFNVDYLKIDQSFVQNMTTDIKSRTIAETIIVMAHQLGLKVIAEGVETVEQRDWLMAAGSDYAQGFLFSEAIPAEQFTHLLERGRMA